ncbi:MAG: DUF1857 family protein [Zoogloeaceae bacterium]|jgi:hypothetical protein|nr:DUF1857 family protein [Zoogloeaceae bacterium]
MRFEHHVPVNSTETPAPRRLTRKDLWRGLWLRVEQPALFMPGLVTSVILAREEGEIRRRLHFSAACVEDRVRFMPEEWVRFDSAPAAGQTGGSLTILIENEGNADNSLALRFCYQTEIASSDGPYIEYLKSAYHASDLETLRVIRKFLAEHKKVYPDKARM